MKKLAKAFVFLALLYLQGVIDFAYARSIEPNTSIEIDKMPPDALRLVSEYLNLRNRKFLGLLSVRVPNEKLNANEGISEYFLKCRDDLGNEYFFYLMRKGSTLRIFR
jgi:hypothetical protein